MPKKGYKLTKEHKEKISKKVKEEFKNLNSPMRSFLSEKNRKKQQSSHKNSIKEGKVKNPGYYFKNGHTVEAIMKQSLSRIGKHHSLETKKKMSESRKKYINENGLSYTFVSSIEYKVRHFLDILGINYIPQYFIKDIKYRYASDIYLLDNKAIIECDGDYWHSFKNIKERDKLKDEALIEAGYRILRLTEYEINNNFNLVRKKILNFLNIKNYNFYLASGFFNDIQINDVNNIKKIGEKLKLSFFSPMDESYIPPNASEEEKSKAIKENISSILKSDFIISNTRHKDVGTMLESGIALAYKIPIIYFCEGLVNGFNLMLAESGIAVATNLQELEHHISELIKNPNYKCKYKGTIE